jgi:branched-chain amino acid transport system ATP-binding protein
MSETSRMTEGLSAHGDGAFLQVDGLEVRYRGAVGVRDVTLQASLGEIVAILGPNGAGKTTTLRAISGFLPGDRARVSAGTIRVGGRSVVRRSPSEITRMGVALVAERNKVFTRLTVRENLLIIGGRPAPKKQQLDEVTELFPFLANRHHQLAGSLSGGERQMLALARALLLRPKVLLVDELSFGLAPIVVDSLIETVRSLAGTDRAVVLVEQSGAVAQALADRIYLLSAGRMVGSGNAAEMLSRDVTDAAYFGQSRAGQGT